MRSIALAIALLSSGCFGNEETPFPEGLEPLEPNLAEAPQPEGSDQFPERIVFLRTDAMDIRPTTPAVHARAYVHAPVSVVWAAMQNGDVTADRKAITSWTTQQVPDPMYDVNYVTHIVVVNVITVEYELTWRQSALEETDGQPTRVAIGWQKTWGSTAIPMLQGSGELREVAPGVTEIQWVEYLRAVMTSHATIESYFTGMFRSVVALSHGQPLPPVSEL
jgi:hypothetical protein